ncbi:MAG: hypothetical protein SFW35_04140 [Chitinophagales bacterium]|nr:hypothetical protein [Chitinophagales bacterium]
MKRTTRVEKDSLGNMVSKIEYANDSIKDGKAYYYYPMTDVIHKEITYKMGKAHGTYKEYYPTGTLKGTLEMLNDFAYGPIKAYYPSGRLEMEGTRNYDMLRGLIKCYFENGMLETLRMFNSSGEPYYTIQYDSSGRVIRDEGHVFHLPFDTRVAKRGEEFSTFIDVAVVPGKRTTIKMGLKGDKLKEIPIKDYRAIFKHTPYNLKDFVVVIQGTMTDENGKVKRDSAELSVFVYGEGK